MELDNIIIVNGLKVKIVYLFKVNSEIKVGRSVISDFSDIIVIEKCFNYLVEFMFFFFKKIISELLLIYKFLMKVVMEKEDSMIVR